MKEMRKCGNEWRYCDGNCYNCVYAHQSSTTATKTINVSMVNPKEVRTVHMCDLTDETIERIAEEVIKRIVRVYGNKSDWW